MSPRTFPANRLPRHGARGSPTADDLPACSIVPGELSTLQLYAGRAGFTIDSQTNTLAFDSEAIQAGRQTIGIPTGTSPSDPERHPSRLHRSRGHAAAAAVVLPHPIFPDLGGATFRMTAWARRCSGERCTAPRSDSSFNGRTGRHRSRFSSLGPTNSTALVGVAPPTGVRPPAPPRPWSATAATADRRGATRPAEPGRQIP